MSITSFTSSNITYSIITGTTNVSVTGHTFSFTGQSAIVIPATITNNNTTYNVVEIADSSSTNTSRNIYCGVFSGYSATSTGVATDSTGNLWFTTLARWLTAITLPSSLTKIGRGAFSGLVKLSVINFGGTNNNTTSSNLTHIGVQAFLDCGSAAGGNIGSPSSNAALASGGVPGTIIFHPNTTNIGGQAFQGCTRLSTITFNQTTINTININGTIQISNCIPYNMFASCTSLSTINGPFITGSSGNTYGIPQNVTQIGNGAFAFCIGIRGFTTTGTGGTQFILRLPSNPGIQVLDNFAFANSGLTSIISDSFPQTLTLIKSNAFRACSNLTTLNIRNTVTTIEDEAFCHERSASDNSIKDTIGLTSITLNRYYENLDRIFAYYNFGYNASNYSTNRTAAMTRVNNTNMTYTFTYASTVPNYACFARSNVRTVTIGNTITGIDNNAFDTCSGLTSVIFTATSTCGYIGNLAFASTALPATFFTTSIPGSITSIGIGAFRQVNTFTTVTIPSTVTILGIELFNSCANLTAVAISATSITTINSDNTTEPNTLPSIVRNCPKITSISSITYPNTVTKLGSYCFSGCSGLTLISSFPSNISIIGNNAFDSCSNLTSIPSSTTSTTFPSTIRSIEASAFASTAISTVTIPSTVTNLGNSIFFNCNLLNNPNIQSAAGLSDSMFSNCAGMIDITLSNITRIGNNTFDGCRVLTNINIPNSVTSIGNDAFDNTGLLAITIPSSVTTCGSNIFTGATSLTSIILNSYFSNLANVLTNLNNPNMSISFNYANEIPANSCLNKTGLRDLTISPGITQIGTAAFSGCSSLLSTTIPASVTNIGNNAFFGCSSLSSVTTNVGLRSIGTNVFFSSGIASITIPSSLTACGNSAFVGCTSLRNIILNAYLSNITSVFSGVNNSNMSWTFNYANEIPVDACNSRSGITSLTISNLITNINNRAFSGCTGLRNVIIGSGVTNIGDTAFLLCTGLTGVIIGSGVKTILTGAFGYCSSLQSIVIPSNVTACGNNAFQACNSLSNIELDTYLSNINLIFNQTNAPNTNYIFDYAGPVPSEACSQKTNVKSVTLGNFITSIEGSSFAGCSGLTGIIFPYSLTNIGDYAFNSCTRIKSITIPSSVIIIRMSTFGLCNSLKNVVIENGVLNISNSCFENCYNLTKISIPNSVTNLEVGVFNSCSNLKDVILPTNIIRIEANLFLNCTSLASIKLPNNITSINAGAFRNCTNLLTIDIPKKVNSIGASAFSNCTSLAGLVIPKNVTTISDYVFSNCSSLDNLFVLSDAIIYKNNFYDINPNANIVLKNVSNIANQSNNIVWYSFSLTLTSNNQNIFNGYFCVDSSTRVINAFYNQTNLSENLIDFTSKDVYATSNNVAFGNVVPNMFGAGNADKDFGPSGIFIKSIPYLDNIYNSNGWRISNTNILFLAYKNKIAGNFITLPENMCSYTITQLTSNPIPLPTQININSL